MYLIPVPLFALDLLPADEVEGAVGLYDGGGGDGGDGGRVAHGQDHTQPGGADRVARSNLPSDGNRYNVRCP